MKQTIHRMGRFLALFLSLSLSLPYPAFALRGQNSDSDRTVSEIKAGLEEGGAISRRDFLVSAGKAAAALAISAARVAPSATAPAPIPPQPQVSQQAPASSPSLPEALRSLLPEADENAILANAPFGDNFVAYRGDYSIFGSGLQITKKDIVDPEGVVLESEKGREDEREGVAAQIGGYVELLLEFAGERYGYSAFRKGRIKLQMASVGNLIRQMVQRPSDFFDLTDPNLKPRADKIPVVIFLVKKKGETGSSIYVLTMNGTPVTNKTTGYVAGYMKVPGLDLVEVTKQMFLNSSIHPLLEDDRPIWDADKNADPKKLSKDKEFHPWHKARQPKEQQAGLEEAKPIDVEALPQRVQELVSSVNDRYHPQEISLSFRVAPNGEGTSFLTFLMREAIPEGWLPPIEEKLQQIGVTKEAASQWVVREVKGIEWPMAAQAPITRAPGELRGTLTITITLEPYLPNAMADLKTIQTILSDVRTNWPDHPEIIPVAEKVLRGDVLIEEALKGQESIVRQGVAAAYIAAKYGIHFGAYSLTLFAKGNLDIPLIEYERAIMHGLTVLDRDRSDQEAIGILTKLKALLKGQPQSPTAGLEEKEIQSIFNRLMVDTTIQQSLSEKGWVPLEPGQAEAFGFKARGGVIIKDSAQVTDAGHFVISDETLHNQTAEQVFNWIKGGQGETEVVRGAKQALVRPGDLIVLKAKPELTVEQVQKLLAENGIEGVRALVGTVQEVETVQVFAFQLFADPNQKWLPPVIELSVAVRLKDEAGNAYTLILMV